MPYEAPLAKVRSARDSAEWGSITSCILTRYHKPVARPDIRATEKFSSSKGLDLRVDDDHTPSPAPARAARTWCQIISATTAEMSNRCQRYDFLQKHKHGFPTIFTADSFPGGRLNGEQIEIVSSLVEELWTAIRKLLLLVSVLRKRVTNSVRSRNKGGYT